MPSGVRRYGRNPQVVSRQIGDELILVPVGAQIVEAQSLYTLNETGGFLWEQLAQERTRAELADALVESFEVDRGRAEQDLDVFLSELEREGCILASNEAGD